MSERPTPETDAFALKFKSACGNKAWVPTDIARRLERERDKSQEDATNYHAKIGELENERDEAREVLDRASLYISNHTGSCPYDLFDIEPHDSPCSEVCDKYTNDMHLCWKKHFANKEAAK